MTDKDLPDRKQILLAAFYLRFHTALILAASASLGFAVNTLLLKTSDFSMFFRFVTATSVAYIGFFIFFRLWLLYVQRALEGPGAIDLRLRLQQLKKSKSGLTTREQKNRSSSADSWLEIADITSELPDDAGSLIFWVALVGLALAFFTVASTPVLVFELLLQSLFASILIRPMRQMDGPDWFGNVFRKTAGAFALMIVLAAVTAFLAHQQCPEARTLAQAFSKVCAYE